MQLLKFSILALLFLSPLLASGQIFEETDFERLNMSLSERFYEKLEPSHSLPFFAPSMPYIDPQAIEKAQEREEWRQRLHEARWKNFRYDPALSTLAAGLESRSYEIYQESFRQVELKFSKENIFGVPGNNLDNFYLRPYYKEALPVFIRRVDSSEHVYVLLSSSYSTWKNGTWLKKTIHLLDKIHHHKATIIALPGYLVPGETLERGQPRIPDLSGKLVAFDLYNRLFKILEGYRQKNPRIQMGVIGFSGGANIAAALLQADDQSAGARGEKIFFNHGAAVFSPILKVARSCACVDSHAREAIEQGWPVEKTLTSVGTMTNLIVNHPQILRDPKKILVLNRENPELFDYLSRAFFNEFLACDLKDLTDSSMANGFSWNPELWDRTKPVIKKDGGMEAWSYKHFYGGYTTRVWRQELLIDGLSSFHSIGLLDSLKNRNETSAPLLVVASLDDPMQSLDAEGLKSIREHGDYEADQESLDVLESLPEIPGVRLKLLKYGSHLGYFLDTAWLEKSLKDFFVDKYSQ